MFHDAEVNESGGVREWRRIERKIHNPFWRAIHNVVAHPLLFFHRPTGEWLHDYTARRMYEQDGILARKQPDVSDKD